MGIWLNQIDIENALTPSVVLALFDDGNTGSVNGTAIAACIDTGEQEVLSWLIDEYGPAPLSAAVQAQLAADPALKYAALDYVKAVCFDRHPEYPQGATDAKERKWRYERADARMERYLSGKQRPPTVATPPANVGGAYVDNGNRIYVDSSDGTSNSGDY